MTTYSPNRGRQISALHRMMRNAVVNVAETDAYLMNLTETEAWELEGELTDVARDVWTVLCGHEAPEYLKGLQGTSRSDDGAPMAIIEGAA